MDPSVGRSARPKLAQSRPATTSTVKVGMHEWPCTRGHPNFSQPVPHPDSQAFPHSNSRNLPILLGTTRPSSRGTRRRRRITRLARCCRTLLSSRMQSNAIRYACLDFQCTTHAEALNLYLCSCSLYLCSCSRPSGPKLQPRSATVGTTSLLPAPQ